MSLSLLQSYSSAEEEDEDDQFQHRSSSDDDDEDESKPSIATSHALYPTLEPSSGGTLLPSALDAFSEIAGPPQFLNNCVEDPDSGRDNEQPLGWRGRRRRRKEKNNLPAGAIVESKAQLVGIHERVRSDIDGSPYSAVPGPPQNDSLSTKQGAVKRVATAMNPNAEDAAELLRMCVQCGIPKTYSSARGMVCPVCGDRPVDPNKQQEKKGSAIKDKEKSKRMKGQSSHATWKSETEMQLRQQFD